MNEHGADRRGPERGGEVTGYGESPLDLAAVAADDRLIEALGRGGPAPSGDGLAGLFAAWRAELTADGSSADTDADLVRAVLADGAAVPDPVPGGPVDHGGVRRPRPAPTGPPAGAGPVDRAPVGPVDRAPVGPVDRVPPAAGPDLRRRPGRRARRVLLGAAAGVAAAALLGLGVNHSAPGDPLWPLVEVVQPDQAAVRAAEHAIALAGNAATAGRYDDARRQLDRALGHTARVRDPVQARRLRADIQRIRGGLPVAGSTGPAIGATPGTTRPDPDEPAQHTPAPTGAPGPTRTPGKAGGPTPAPAAPGPPTTSPAPPGIGLPIPLVPSLLPSGLPLLPTDGCLLLCPPD